MGLGAVVLGLVLLCAAFVFWNVNGIAAIDTLDGKPPGLLHGYGVIATLMLAGVGALVFGVRRIAVRRS